MPSEAIKQEEMMLEIEVDKRTTHKSNAEEKQREAVIIDAYQYKNGLYI